MNAVSLAIPGRPIPARSVRDADEFTCTLWYIRRRLGHTRYSDRKIVKLVTALIEQRGFPRPLPCLKKGELVDAVIPASTWQRPAVDTWLDDFLPPAATAALDAAAREAAAADMDAAAATLGLTLVNGGRA